MTEQRDQITVSQQNSVVTVAGEIDLATAGDMEKGVLDAEAAGSPLVIDLREVTFIDSTGISVLVGAAARSEERGQRCTVRAVQPMMRRVFRLMALEVILDFEPPLVDDVNVEEAVAFAD